MIDEHAGEELVIVVTSLLSTALIVVYVVWKTSPPLPSVMG